MQPMTNRQNMLFHHLQTPEQLEELEARKMSARKKLLAHLDVWNTTGQINYPPLRDLEWPADELVAQPVNA